jgi:LysM repeat protein
MAPTAAPMAAGPVYTVKSGDSLWKIARANNTTVAALKQANNLSSDALKVGQKLSLPAGTAPAATAAPAETAKAATTPITAAAIPASYAYGHEPGQFTENGQTIHYVDSGESLAVIAKRYGVKTDDLIKANNLTKASHLQYGQRLVVPLAPAAPAAAAPVSAISSGPALAAPVVTAGTGN